jgi:UDPglucose 6-dehydrogenase
MRYVWELKGLTEEKINQKLAQIFVYTNSMEATHKAHAIAVLTEWDVFKTYDWESIYSNMYKPAFVFDGRNILDVQKLAAIGFQVKSIGKG